MKTKLTLLAAGACVAFLCNQPVLATEDIYTNLPDEHQGARHFLFTGTQTSPSYTDHGTPTPDGYGFRNAKGSTVMTLSIPDLGITDLVINLEADVNADRDENGNGTTWGGQRPVIDEKYAGRIYFTGVDQKASDTLTTHTRQLGGCFWGGLLNGAHLVATEQIEDTTESNGSVISSVSSINGVVIIPWYEGFAPFDAMSSLPPLKPLTELPQGLGWRPYAWSGKDHHGDSGHIWVVTIEELGIVDLRIRLSFGDDGAPNQKGKPVYGNSAFTAVGHSSEPVGWMAFMGVRGTGTIRADIVHHDNIAAFWKGPFAGCLLLETRQWPSTIDHGVLLVPDAVDLDAPQKMLNVSERGRVGIGDDILIAGFVVSGSLPKMMLVRGVGPGLAQYGVTEYLPDPKLEVYRNTQVGPVLVGSNDNWGSGDGSEVRIVSGEAGAFALESGSLDAAILFSWLEPGAYTVQVSGVDGATGVALAEVYEVGN